MRLRQGQYLRNEFDFSSQSRIESVDCQHSRSVVKRVRSIVRNEFPSGIIAGVPVPFPIPVSDGCKLGLNCPVNNGDVNVAKISLQVLSSYPSISLYAKIEVKADDAKEDFVCLQFPATITGSNGHGRSIDQWQEGHLFEPRQ